MEQFTKALEIEIFLIQPLYFVSQDTKFEIKLFHIFTTRGQYSTQIIYKASDFRKTWVAQH